MSYLKCEYSLSDGGANEKLRYCTYFNQVFFIEDPVNATAFHHLYLTGFMLQIFKSTKCLCPTALVFY